MALKVALFAFLNALVDATSLCAVADERLKSDEAHRRPHFTCGSWAACRFLCVMRVLDLAPFARSNHRLQTPPTAHACRHEELENQTNHVLYGVCSLWLAAVVLLLCRREVSEDDDWPDPEDEGECTRTSVMPRSLVRCIPQVLMTNHATVSNKTFGGCDVDGLLLLDASDRGR